MFRFVGAFIVSLVISNWLYAEFVLMLPATKPYIEDSIASLSIPTHDTWGDIAYSAEAKQFSSEMKNEVSSSKLGSLVSLFSHAGHSNQQAQRSPENSSTFTARPFKTGKDIFLSAKNSQEIFGGYQRFIF